MRIFNKIEELPSFKQAVITIGSFDGVHKGHLKILKLVVEKAKAIGGESILVSFDPHPRKLIKDTNGHSAPIKLLHNKEEKIERLKKIGLDNLVLVPFTKEFAAQEPETYVRDFLLKKFNPAYIVIGYDHRFGKNRAGNIEILKSIATQSGVKVIEISAREVDEVAISSTRVRKALNEGDITKTNNYLGYAYQFSGIVVHGKKLGKTIGYPTANILIGDEDKLIPGEGIYAVKVKIGKEKYGGMMYIGRRPIIKDDDQLSIEVNIFDFEGDLYEQLITIETISFLRGDMNLSGMDALKSQLAEDEKHAKQELSFYDTAVVILNYNGHKHLKEFLPSVVKNTPSSTRIIVVDNGSTDDSRSFIEQEYPEVHLLCLDENHGFAGGYNEALEEICASYYLLLNSDVEVSPYWLEPLIDRMASDDSIGACQPKVLSYKQKDHFEYAGASGGYIDYLGYAYCRGRIISTVEKDEGQYDDEADIFWTTGAAMIVRSELFHGLGGFDASYFAHFEEIDLCWRIKRAGYSIKAIPASTVYHLGGGTLAYDTPNKTFLNFRNSLFTLLKNKPADQLIWLILFRLALDGVAAALFLTEGKFKHIWAVISAHFSFYRHFFSMLKNKKQFNKYIQSLKIGDFNPGKEYYISLIWRYYIRSQKRYSQLKKKL